MAEAVHPTFLREEDHPVRLSEGQAQTPAPPLARRGQPGQAAGGGFLGRWALSRVWRLGAESI